MYFALLFSIGSGMPGITSVLIDTKQSAKSGSIVPQSFLMWGSILWRIK